MSSGNNDSLIIFTNEKKPWFNSGDTSNLSINPVGKSKGSKKSEKKCRASANSGPEVINPCFSPMSEICTDPFWKATFVNASYGEFHRGFKFDKNNNKLIYKFKNKIWECDISGQSVINSILMIQKFMGERGNIMSASDIELRKRYINQLRINNTEDVINFWGKIKSDNHKQILLCKFVESIAEYHNLCEVEIDQLSEILRLGVAIKKFDLNNIEMKDGLIVKINGLIRLPNGCFDIDPNLVVKKVAKKKVEKHNEEDEDVVVYGKVNILKKWNKLVDTVSKKSLSKSIARANTESVSQSESPN